mgnify:CR=1 FL=1
MSVIVEVHTKDEAKNSIKFKDALIGINNRNLKTLKTDVNTTYDIHDILINHSGPLISESGIKTKEEVLEIAEKTKIKTFLIGGVSLDFSIPVLEQISNTSFIYNGGLGIPPELIALTLALGLD